MILVIDNYDSFVFNLARYVRQLVPDMEIQVRRNDQLDLDQIEKMTPQAIIISPGPGSPEDANQTLSIIEHFSSRTAILGVCLGHQSIGAAMGATVIPSGHPMHGRSSTIFHNGHAVFRQIPSPFVAGRYHSLILDPATLPESLEIIAKTDEGIIMAIAHRELPIIGYQFHPESVLTSHGYQLIANFLEVARIDVTTELGELSSQTPSRLSVP